MAQLAHLPTCKLKQEKQERCAYVEEELETIFTFILKICLFICLLFENQRKKKEKE